MGEGSKYAAQMWLEDINKAGGLMVGGKQYKVEVVIEDNESKAESAVKANTKMITEDEVIAIVGPQSSAQAIPAGGVANNYETPMISPWSTNPDTTKDRPYVFRGCFLDPFQGPVVANFVKSQFGFTKAAVCCLTWPATTPRDWPKCSKKPGRNVNGPGSVVAYESFTTKDADFSSQLTKIINSGAEFFFTPQYYNEVALIVKQAHELGWNNTHCGQRLLGFCRNRCPVRQRLLRPLFQYTLCSCRRQGRHQGLHRSLQRQVRLCAR